jgi:hypothetical protein
MEARPNRQRQQHARFKFGTKSDTTRSFDSRWTSGWLLLGERRSAVWTVNGPQRVDSSRSLSGSERLLPRVKRSAIYNGWPIVAIGRVHTFVPSPGSVAPPYGVLGPQLCQPALHPKQSRSALSDDVLGPACVVLPLGTGYEAGNSSARCGVPTTEFLGLRTRYVDEACRRLSCLGRLLATRPTEIGRCKARIGVR